jgi:hypothetical protein
MEFHSVFECALGTRVPCFCTSNKICNRMLSLYLVEDIKRMLRCSVSPGILWTYCHLNVPVINIIASDDLKSSILNYITSVLVFSEKYEMYSTQSSRCYYTSKTRDLLFFYNNFNLFHAGWGHHTKFCTAD